MTSMLVVIFAMMLGLSVMLSVIVVSMLVVFVHRIPIPILLF
jgi:hypothetical protein